MPLQADINEKMRAILVDWLVEVHLKFKVPYRPLSLLQAAGPADLHQGYTHEMRWCD
jgi:hypothetical protein